MITWKGKTTGENLRRCILSKLKIETFLNNKRVLEYQTRLGVFMQKQAWQSILFLKKQCVTFGYISSFYAQRTPTKSDFDIEKKLELSLNSFDYLTRMARNSLYKPKPIQLLPPLPNNNKDEVKAPHPSSPPLASLHSPPKRSLDSLLPTPPTPPSHPSKRVKVEHTDNDDSKSELSEVYDIIPDFAEQYGNQDAYFNDHEIFKNDESDDAMIPLSPVSPLFPFPDNIEEDDKGIFIFDTDDSSSDNDVVEEKEETTTPAIISELDKVLFEKSVNLLDLFDEERYSFDDHFDYNVI